MEKKSELQKEAEELIAKHGQRGAEVVLLIQIRDELRKLNKRGE